MKGVPRVTVCKNPPLYITAVTHAFTEAPNDIIFDYRIHTDDTPFGEHVWTKDNWFIYIQDEVTDVDNYFLESVGDEIVTVDVPTIKSVYSNELPSSMRLTGACDLLTRSLGVLTDRNGIYRLRRNADEASYFSEYHTGTSIVLNWFDACHFQHRSQHDNAKDFYNSFNFIGGTFHNCRFSNCDDTPVKFAYCNLYNCTFDDDLVYSTEHCWSFNILDQLRVK